jgi:hypothetical protein
LEIYNRSKSLHNNNNECRGIIIQNYKTYRCHCLKLEKNLKCQNNIFLETCSENIAPTLAGTSIDNRAVRAETGWKTGFKQV